MENQTVKKNQEVLGIIEKGISGKMQPHLAIEKLKTLFFVNAFGMQEKSQVKVKNMEEIVNSSLGVGSIVKEMTSVLRSCLSNTIAHDVTFEFGFETEEKAFYLDVDYPGVSGYRVQAEAVENIVSSIFEGSAEKINVNHRVTNVALVDFREKERFAISKIKSLLAKKKGVEDEQSLIAQIDSLIDPPHLDEVEQETFASSVRTVIDMFVEKEEQKLGWSTVAFDGEVLRVDIAFEDFKGWKLFKDHIEPVIASFQTETKVDIEFSYFVIQSFSDKKSVTKK